MRRWTAATVIVIAAALTACGEETPPAESVPALAQHLERVDAAIANDDPARARRQIEALVDETTRALMDEQLTAEQADEILSAAAELLRRLPEEKQPEEKTSPEPESTPSPPPTTLEPDPDDHDHDHDKGKHKDKHDKHEDDEGHDHGHDDD